MQTVPGSNLQRLVVSLLCGKISWFIGRWANSAGVKFAC